MSYEIRVQVNCPICNGSLMEPGVQVDALDSILFLAKVGSSRGHLYLSQIYGSYSKIFKHVDDLIGSVVECACPRCNAPFPVVGSCKCKAPIIALNLKDGGKINVCTRNGCKKHSLEFEDINAAFSLFQNQDRTGLFYLFRPGNRNWASVPRINTIDPANQPRFQSGHRLDSACSPIYAPLLDMSGLMAYCKVA